MATFPRKLREWSEKIKAEKNCLELATELGELLSLQAAEMVVKQIIISLKKEDEENEIFMYAWASIMLQAFNKP